MSGIFTHNLRSNRRLHRPGPGLGLLLALACLWLAPSAAQASCSDYVIIGNPSAEAVRNQMHHADGNLPANPLSPCAGGECRSAPSRSALPLQQVVTTPSHSDALAQLQFVTPPAFSPRSAAIHEDARLMSEDHSLSPEPPPRAL